MIYKNNLFSKEQKQAFIEKKESRQKIVWYGVIVALLTFALHFMLQTLTRSILPQAVPQYMMASYFSTLSLYILIAFILYIAYMVRYYNFLTFAEISQNKWYSLAKNGYDPTSMILTKLIVRLIEVIEYFTIGFITIIVLTLFLKYPFVINYMFTLYLIGLVDIIFLCMITMSCSLFITKQKNARYIISLAGVCIWLIRIISNFYAMSSDRNWMSNITNIFHYEDTTYLLYFFIMAIICLVIVIVRARRIAQYTNFEFYEKDVDIEQDIKIIIPTQDSYEEVRGSFVARQRRKGIDKIVNTIMIFIITIGVILNVFVLFVSLSSPERETNFFGIIPFVFHTESMEPKIMYNDLAFFRSVDHEQPLVVGSTILYHSNDGAQVANINAIKGSTLSVDILKYADASQKGSYQRVIQRDAIYGTYEGRSRWLGMIILFANTVLGRLILLLIPALMLYYYKPIIAYLQRKGIIVD